MLFSSQLLLSKRDGDFDGLRRQRRFSHGKKEISTWRRKERIADAFGQATEGGEKEENPTSSLRVSVIGFLLFSERK